MTSDQNNIYVLPDYLFAKYCEDVYGLNRGVYNTIDNWFFEKDQNLDIESRRKLIMEFLQFYQRLEGNQKMLKFGRGRLTKMLEKFLGTVTDQTVERKVI